MRKGGNVERAKRNIRELWHSVGVVFLVVLSLVFFAACGSSDNSVDSGNDDSTTTHYIKNLGVNFDRYDSSTGKAGDFVFLASGVKPFIEFGTNALTDQQGNPKDNPAFEYYLDPEANVYAITKGTVTRIEYQESTEDYEIFTRETGANFMVIYDHITTPTISKGDSINVGDPLGKPGTWNTLIGRFEIQINVDQDQGELSFCPFMLFDPDLVDEFKEKVSQLMRDWETFKGDQSIYDEASHVYPGCLSETAVP